MSFLEYYLCIKAQKNHIDLAYNSQNPQEPPVEYIKKYELEHRYFDEIGKITSAVGFPIFASQNDKQSNAESHAMPFFIRNDSGDCNAKAIYDGEQMIVKRLSKASSSKSIDFPNYNEFKKLESEHIIVNNKFQKDYPFSSPTEAANIVCHRKVDGRQIWKTHDRRSIKDIFG